jgi:hypothetical protein
MMNNTKKGILMMIDWIDMKADQPHEFEHVLVYDAGFRACVGYRVGNEIRAYPFELYAEFVLLEDATYWLPLPKLKEIASD